jgi:hypothetical protein
MSSGHDHLRRYLEDLSAEGRAMDIRVIAPGSAHCPAYTPHLHSFRFYFPHMSGEDPPVVELSWKAYQEWSLHEMLYIPSK